MANIVRVKKKFQELGEIKGVLPPEVAEMIQEMSNKKQARIKAMQIPEDIVRFIHKKGESTAKLNGEGFDKSTFRLGMMSMYFHLKDKIKDGEQDKFDF